MKNIKYKIGDVARKTGITIRTLRYYNEIGLLDPAKRSRSGYRLYSVEELKRLQKILSLQQLGFSLAFQSRNQKAPRATLESPYSKT